MAIANLGISKSDFEDQAFDDFYQAVTRTPITKVISNETGSPTYTQGTGASINAIFRRRNQNFDWAKEGFVEQGDCLFQVKQDQAMEKDDIITVGTEKYRIGQVIMRTIGGVNMFKVANGFLI